MAEDRAPGLPTIDVHEYGGKKDGERQKANRRLFMQLLVFEHAGSTQDVEHALEARKIPSVLYADCNDPRAYGLLTWSEDPAHFVDVVRPLFGRELAGAAMRNDFAMIGRTYATGHEPDLLDSLLARPVRNALNPKLGWHVWYPLRRSGGFARLEPPEVAELMKEHAMIGHAYGQQELATDIRRIDVEFSEVRNPRVSDSQQCEVTVHLTRSAEDAYELIVMRSYAETLWEMLLEATREFGSHRGL